MRTIVLGMVFGVGVAGSSLAQATKSAVVADPYAAEPLVIERTDMRYHMASDGTGFHERTVVARVQAESTLKQLGVLSVPFAANSEHVEWIYARVRHGDGTVTETPVNTAIETVDPVTREAPFYSDLKQMQIPLRDLRIGDRLEWKARVVKTKAEAPGEFWGQEAFSKEAVALSQTVELEVPRGKYVNVWSPGLKPLESDAGEDHVYQWEFAQTKPTVGPEADAAKEVKKKHVLTAEEELEEREGKLPDVAWTTFKSWEAVGAWYRGLEGERFMPDAEVKAKVAQLTAGKITEQEKVQAVYGYVATQIHYIGVAFGVGRFQPHSAGDVLQNQYGDCKDKTTLLAAMLEALGLHPDAVLIGAGVRFNPAVPSPSSFNHAITRVEVGGKPVWLDTTAEVAPYGVLVYVTRDHDALVIPAVGDAKVERTPAGLPFTATATMDAVGTLGANGVSASRLTLTFRGDDELIMRSVLRQISPAQYDELAQRMCASIGYGGTASHLETSRAEDTSEPLKMSFDYKRVKAGDWADYRTIPQLSPVTLPRPDEKEPPVESIALGIPRVEVSTAAMKVPEGWGVEFPEAVHEKSAYATYDETYRFEKGTIYAQRRVEVLKERVPVSEWKSYNKFAVKVDLGNEQYVQLTRTAKLKADAGKTAAHDALVTEVEVGPPAAGENNAEASKLIGEAYAALQRFDKEAAGPLLDKAKALNAGQNGLWGTYGYLSFQRGDLPEAIKDYQKELTLHPANTNWYPPLIQSQIALKHKAEAKTDLRRWQAADPANAIPALSLGGMELSEGNAAGAVEIVDSALALTPADEKKNEQLELLLGRAQLKSGMKEKGHATLLALVKSTDDIDMMNNAAYELADAGLELPLAEQTTRAALDKMEEQSGTWTLDENLVTLRQKTRMLQATWDTMGWVYFRDGKLGQAEQYIEAAWKGRQDAEVGKHMGEIALARGDKNAALSDFELAQATFPSYDLMGVHTEPGNEQKDLMARTDTLRKGGAHSSTPDARATLQKMRTIPLGSAAGLNGVAEYKILVSAGAVERAAPSGEKRLAGGEDRLKKAKLTGFTPAGSKAKLVLIGLLNCHSGICEVVLEP